MLLCARQLLEAYNLSNANSPVKAGTPEHQAGCSCLARQGAHVAPTPLSSRYCKGCSAGTAKDAEYRTEFLQWMVSAEHEQEGTAVCTARCSLQLQGINSPAECSSYGTQHTTTIVHESPTTCVNMPHPPQITCGCSRRHCTLMQTTSPSQPRLHSTSSRPCPAVQSRVSRKHGDPPTTKWGNPHTRPKTHRQTLRATAAHMLFTSKPNVHLYTACQAPHVLQEACGCTCCSPVCSTAHSSVSTSLALAKSGCRCLYRWKRSTRLS